MSRAVLLPTPGDPYLVKNCISLYQKIYKDEISNLYVWIQNNGPDEIGTYCKSIIEDAGGKAFWNKAYPMQHGDTIKTLLELCNEDYICLLEDDGWVLEKGILDSCFSLIESGQYDVLGSTRGASSPNLIDAITRKFNLNTSVSPEHLLSACPNLWPCFVFSRKDTLLATDRNFNSMFWPSGSYIKELEFTTTTDIVADTFVWASIQLRAMGCKFGYVHQYHAGPVDKRFYQAQQASYDDMFVMDGGSGQLTKEEYKTTAIQNLLAQQYPYNLFNIKPLPWIHFGSLSSSMTGLFRDENNLSLGLNADMGIYPVFDSGTIPEIARRLAIYQLLYEHNQIQYPEISWYNIKYINALWSVIRNCNIPELLIREYYDTYRALLPIMFERK